MTAASKDQRAGWLRELKAGDKVGIVPRSQLYGFGAGVIRAAVGTISAVTPTGRIRVTTPKTTGHTEYRTDGWQSGCGDDRLCPVDDARALIAKSNAQGALCRAADDLSAAAVAARGVSGIGAHEAAALTDQITTLTAAIRAATGSAT